MIAGADIKIKHVIVYKKYHMKRYINTLLNLVGSQNGILTPCLSCWYFLISFTFFSSIWIFFLKLLLSLFTGLIDEEIVIKCFSPYPFLTKESRDFVSDAIIKNST
jgi:hypothetical protein